MSERKFQKKLEKIRKQGERDKQEYELREAYAKYAPEKKKKKVSNILLFTIVVAITTYTVASFWLTYVTGVSIDSTLTTCFYTFWGSELVLLAGIKVSKVLKKPEDDYAETDYMCGDENIYE